MPNPALQRFVSEDPLGFGGSDVNLYAYAWSAPTDYVDPFGLCPICVVSIVVAESPAAAAAAAAAAVPYAAWRPGQAVADMIRDLATGRSGSKGGGGKGGGAG